MKIFRLESPAPPQTVKKHLQVIFEKLGAATRAEAAVIALRRQLLKT